ncbi:hypothetical protein [Edaphobacter modestus]|uniref:Uncharacterized protein n=1 Tax=Edaphobacter modestus TaxID=388466 RepID=A0A4Q7YR57_9BACT|nr:hypothetical protein [Edaphobacter modestus]RZU39319.1 hypothetical protein BDD14_0688 [Edaphobacter modestus]
MPIIIHDDTANAVVMTIDNNGNLAFGDGTPINMLTLNGYGIIDSEGYIVHGLGNSAVLPTSGSVFVSAPGGISGGLADVSTTPGVIPMVVPDTTYPAIFWNVETDSSGNEYETETTLFEPLHVTTPYTGGFEVRCNTGVGNDQIITPGSAFYEPSVAAGTTCFYRWI